MFEIEVMNEGQTNVIIFAAEEVDILCRSCLNKGASVNLFEIAYKGTLFSEIFNSLFAQLNQFDILPKKICNECIILFTQFCAFKEQIIQSQALLELTLGSKTKVDNATEKNVEVKEEKDALGKYSRTLYDDENKVEEKNFSKVGIKQEKTVDWYTIHKVEDVTVKKEVADYDQDSHISFFKEIVVDENEISHKSEIKLKEEKEYSCSFCDKKFCNIVKYRNHRQKELLIRRPKKICHICSKAVVSNKLTEHLISHSNEKPFSCDVCGMKFSRKENLSRHKYTHTAVKPHMCHICGKGFIQAPHLTDHLRTHNYIAPFVSQYCGRKFTNKQAFEQHLKLHKKNPELNCKERKRTEKYLNGKYVCEYCKKELKTKQLLEFHTRSHTGDRPYLCCICGHKFIQNAHLKTHLHLHKGDKPYSCGYCGKSFARKGNLNQHVQIHTGDRPYTCNVCQKGFCTRSSLKKHKVVHNVK